VGVRTFDTGQDPVYRRHGPTVLLSVLVGVVVLLGLLANGRPIGSLPPRTLPVRIVAAPVFAACQGIFALDETGMAVAGKIAASVFVAMAAALLFAAAGRRRPTDEAWGATLLFSFGTVAWAASQTLTASAPAAALIAAALGLAVRAEDDEDWAPRVALPLALAVAVNPADLGLAAGFGLALALRRPRQFGGFALWALPGMALVAASWVAGGAPPLAIAGFVENAAALFASPALGLLVFAPVTLVGLVGAVRAAGREDGMLAVACVLGFLAHALFTALLPLGGGTWGAVSWTEALPLVLLFVPEGLDALRMVGTALALLSVAIQALGAFSYDQRWDRLNGPGDPAHPAWLWDLPRSPIPFQIRERVAIVALPAVDAGQVRIREHRIVWKTPTGSRLTGSADTLHVGGSDATFQQAHLLAGARVAGERIAMGQPGDGVFVREREASRSRRLELRVAGRGRGTLALLESSFWGPAPRVREKAVNGDFRIAFPYHYLDGGGGDLRLLLRSGAVSIAWISLVPPNDRDDAYRIEGTPEE
jgi:hypothetical protein